MKELANKIIETLSTENYSFLLINSNDLAHTHDIAVVLKAEVSLAFPFIHLWKEMLSLSKIKGGSLPVLKWATPNTIYHNSEAVVIIQSDYKQSLSKNHDPRATYQVHVL